MPSVLWTSSVTLGCLLKRLTIQQIGRDEGRPQDLRLIRMRFFMTAIRVRVYKDMDSCLLTAGDDKKGMAGRRAAGGGKGGMWQAWSWRTVALMDF